MNRLATEDGEITSTEAINTAVRVFNASERERERERGFSTVQHALGKSPDCTGRFVNSLDGRAAEAFIENPNAEFQTNVERMRAAEQAHSQWAAKIRKSKKP